MQKKILFVIESLSGGGAEKVLSVLLKFFDHNKYQVTVCPIVDAGIYCEEVKKYIDYYVPVVSYKGGLIKRLCNKLKYKLIYSILPLKWVYNWFIPQNNDVEIAFCEGYVTKLLSQAKSESRKIAWIHTDLIDHPWPIKSGIFKNVNEERKAYSRFDKIVCVSHAVEKAFHTKYGLEEQTLTIYNPIDVDSIREFAKQSTHEKGIVKVISVGRLVPQKGYDRLLKVAKQLYDDGLTFRLMIIGEGQERSALEKYISDNAMESYVSLPGYSKNPYKNMADSNIFVCSSRAEGFSLVVAEAIILGVPVISTYCSGPYELLDGGRYGMLVENSIEGLYNGMKSMLTNETIRFPVSTDEFTNRFRADVIVDEIYRIL